MSKIHGNGGDLGDRLESGARDLGARMESSFETVKDRVGELGGRIGGLVKEHPMVSLAAGVGIGFLFGRLMTRR
jgi:ElaB/YqjD/DUF883 family membrane-anchored ribosome-binding protein